MFFSPQLVVYNWDYLMFFILKFYVFFSLQQLDMAVKQN